MEHKIFCCKEWEDYVKKMDGESFSIGEGEISGSISFHRMKRDGQEVFEINVSDGWNAYPELVIRHCPCCGTRLS